MIEDKSSGIRFSGEEFMSLWRSSTELEANYNTLRRKYEHLEDLYIKLEQRVQHIEWRESHD